jgi:hypothetical protein
MDGKVSEIRIGGGLGEPRTATTGLLSYTPGMPGNSDAALAQARLAVMGTVIADLPAGEIDRLEPLWRELLDHHLAAAPHLAALGAPRDPAGSWEVRRSQLPAMTRLIFLLHGGRRARACDQAMGAGSW